MHLFAGRMYWPNFASKTKFLTLPHHRSGRVATDDCDALWIEHARESSVRLWHVSATKLAQETARNDVALNFTGAIPNAVNACIAPHALEWQFVH